MSNQIIAAADLYRNTRVVLDLNEMPHLVDSVTEQADGNLSVVFSSGEQRIYGPAEPVVIRESL